MFEFYDGQATETKESKPEQSQEKPQKSSKRRSVFKIKGRGGGKERASSEPETTVDGKTWQQALLPWISLLTWLMLICLGFVAIWNIAPYEAMVRAIASRFEGSALGGFLLALPLIGWGLQMMGAFIFWVIGGFIWALVQSIELMPIVMTNHPGYLRSVLKAHDATPKFKEHGDDPGIVRALKGFYNRLPLRYLILSRRLRGWVYLFDLLVVFAVYPPVDSGGLERFFFLLGTGQWGRLNWGNIFIAIVALFIVEIVFKQYLVTNHFRKYLKKSAGKADSKAVSA